MKLSPILTLALAALVGPLSLLADSPKTSDSFVIENIPLPEGVPPEVGAVGFGDDGRLFVALRRSDVLVAMPTEDPTKFEWKLFASGLHNACGMEVISNHEIVISQMPELTRIIDTDEDGVADRYENISSAWGMSGNYHETNHLVPDGKGGYYVAVGTASHNGPVFYNVRGEYSEIGRRGRNYSAASWKGWILHIDKEGNTEPFASGFRMHNGIYLDSKGNLWSGDNQGDWKATTPLYHVEKGNFYGHVSSLVWDPEFEEGKDPLLLPPDKIREMKTDAAVLLPHGEMNRSASEPIEIPAEYGPFAGQLLLPDNNGTRISRIMLEEIDGTYQGACTHFINDETLGSGNNRVVFSPDKKTLYVGQTTRGWGKLAEGLKRIEYTGQVPFDVLSISLKPKGFELNFTQPVAEDAAETMELKLQSFRYEDGPLYGGDQLDRGDIATGEVKLVDEDTLFVGVEDLKDGGWVYQFDLGGVTNAKGHKPLNDLFFYTVNKLAK